MIIEMSNKSSFLRKLDDLDAKIMRHRNTCVSRDKNGVVSVGLPSKCDPSSIRTSSIVAREYLEEKLNDIRKIKYSPKKKERG